MTDEQPPHQPTAEDALAARLQLEVAVQQLVTPTVHQLDRSRAEADPAVAATAAEADLQHEQQMARLRARFAAAAVRHDDVGTRRALTALLDRERAYKTTLAARTAAAATIPSLLDQLQSAVESSQGGGTGRSGVHRSPIGLAAAELLGAIQHAVGHHHLTPLADSLQSWATRTIAGETSDLVQCAGLAERWVAAAREIVTPNRSFELAGPCPVCGTRYVWQPDDTGTHVRRAALQVRYASRSAQCIAHGCGAHWPPELLDHLARVVVQDRSDRDRPA